MAKKTVQAKDQTRVTVRFHDEAVAEEFYRRADEAGMRPSPFAAELIEQALTADGPADPKQSPFEHELTAFRSVLEFLRDLPRQFQDAAAGNDDILSELALLRKEISDLREVSANPGQPPEELRKVLRQLEEVRNDVAEVAQLPHVFVKLREDVATGIRPLLVRTCGLTHDEAEEWIRTNILEE
ncbi:MAG: hypothetical protein GXX96_13610 [Planctomycetaceae bacterium]|nr:hypothetical protein [Planctomycetaceae bacterium]